MLHGDIKFRKAKSYCNNFWVGMVEKCRGLLSHVTLENLIYFKNEWINLVDFLHTDTNSSKLKITSIILYLRNELIN